MATRQYVLVSLAKQPISLFFSNDALTAMMEDLGSSSGPETVQKASVQISQHTAA